MDYSPFNPVVWALFLGFAAITWGVVRLFAAKNPGYPGNLPDDMAMTAQQDSQEPQFSTPGPQAGEAP